MGTNNKGKTILTIKGTLEVRAVQPAEFRKETDKSKPVADVDMVFITEKGTEIKIFGSTATEVKKGRNGPWISFNFPQYKNKEGKFREFVVCTRDGNPDLQTKWEVKEAMVAALADVQDLPPNPFDASVKARKNARNDI